MNILKVKPVFVSTISILVFGIVFGTLPNSNLFPNITITPFYVQLNNTGGTVKFIGTISPKTVGQNLSNFTYHWFLSSSYGAPNSTIVSGCEVNELNCTVSVPLTSKTTYFFLQLYAQNKTGATLGPSSYIKEKINNTQTTTTTTIPTTINTTTTSSTTTSTTTTGSTTTSPWSQPINITIGHPINYEGWVITLDSYNQNYTATFTVSYNGSSRSLTVAHLTATETSVDNDVHILQIYNINNLSNHANNGGVIIELSSLVNNVSISTTSTTSTTTTGSTTTSPWSQSINITIGHPINYEGWVITLDSYNQNYTAIFTVSHGGSSSNLTMVIGMASTTSVDNGVYEIEIDYLSKFSNGAVISLITFVNNPPTPSTSSNSTQFPNNTEVILNIRKGWNLLSVPAGNNNAQKLY